MKKSEGLTPRQKLGVSLRAMRIAMGMTQWDVAEKLGYSTAQFVSNWERGISTPSRAVLGQLAVVLGVKLVDLVDSVFAAELEEVVLEKQRTLKELRA